MIQSALGLILSHERKEIIIKMYVEKWRKIFMDFHGLSRDVKKQHPSNCVHGILDPLSWGFHLTSAQFFVLFEPV